MGAFSSKVRENPFYAAIVRRGAGSTARSAALASFRWLHADGPHLPIGPVASFRRFGIEG
jgi:hypothetical protein